MAKQSIFLGTVSNDGTGTNLRGGGSIINQNFDEIYTAIGDGTNLKGYITIEDTSSTVDTVNIGEKLQFHAFLVQKGIKTHCQAVFTKIFPGPPSNITRLRASHPGDG